MKKRKMKLNMAAPPGPEIEIQGKTYRPAVLLVTDRDHLGRPAAARFIHEEQTVDLAELAAGKDEGEAVAEFVIVFACRETWGAAEPKDPQS